MYIMYMYICMIIFIVLIIILFILFLFIIIQYNSQKHTNAFAKLELSIDIIANNLADNIIKVSKKENKNNSNFEDQFLKNVMKNQNKFSYTPGDNMIPLFDVNSYDYG